MALLNWLYSALTHSFHSRRVWWGQGIRPLWKSYLFATKEACHLKRKFNLVLSNILMTHPNQLLRLNEQQLRAKIGVNEVWTSQPGLGSHSIMELKS